jgi:hypothetical protein
MTFSILSAATKKCCAVLSIACLWEQLGLDLYLGKGWFRIWKPGKLLLILKGSIYLLAGGCSGNPLWDPISVLAFPLLAASPQVDCAAVRTFA